MEMERGAELGGVLVCFGGRKGVGLKQKCIVSQF